VRQLPLKLAHLVGQLIVRHDASFHSGSLLPLLGDQLIGSGSRERCGAEAQRHLPTFALFCHKAGPPSLASITVHGNFSATPSWNTL